MFSLKWSTSENATIWITKPKKDRDPQLNKKCTLAVLYISAILLCHLIFFCRIAAFLALLLCCVQNVALLLWRLITLLVCSVLTMSLCRYFTRFVTLLPCYFVTLSLCYFVTFLLCYFVTLSLCYFIYFVTWLLCYFVTLLLCYFLFLCFFVTL